MLVEAEPLIGVVMDDRSGDPAPGSCDVSDACDELGVRAVRTGALTPVWHGCPPLRAPVATVTLEPAPGSPTPLTDLLDVLADARGCVVLVGLGGRVDVQCWGSLLATAARRFGVQGVLVDGAVRDVDGLQELRFPCFARGVHPAGMRGRLRLVSAGEPVDVDGAAVAPGSLAVADASGVVFVPHERRVEALALASERRSREHRLLQAIVGGADPRAVLDSVGRAEEER